MDFFYVNSGEALKVVDWQWWLKKAVIFGGDPWVSENFNFY